MLISHKASTTKDNHRGAPPALGWDALYTAWDEYLRKFCPTAPGSAAPRGKKQTILVIPPDISRLHSAAGELTARLYASWSPYATIKIMPALGTHRRMTPDELRSMFGPQIPLRDYLYHDWRWGVVRAHTLGARELVRLLGTDRNEEDGESGESGDSSVRLRGTTRTGQLHVYINHHIMSRRYTRIVSIGQVAPHEVVGMSNHVKNLVIGCGGKQVIDFSHYYSAKIGMANLIGTPNTPIRTLLNAIYDASLAHLPVHFAMTVMTEELDGIFRPYALCIGDDTECFDAAAAASTEANIIPEPRCYDLVVAYLPRRQYRSLWLANKAIYRLSDIVATGGELLIIAPGVDRVAEDDAFGDLIVRHGGYMGSAAVERELNQSGRRRRGRHSLSANLAVAAHLIHGSPEERYKVTYATDSLSPELLQRLGYQHRTLASINAYRPFRRPVGGCTNALGRDYYYVYNPGFRLWRCSSPDRALL